MSTPSRNRHLSAHKRTTSTALTCNAQGQHWTVPFENDPLQPTYAIGVINLARLTNTPTLLDCYTLGGPVAFEWTREDGTVAPDDLEQCIDGALALAKLKATISYVFSERGRVVKGCRGPRGQCAEARTVMVAALHTRGTVSVGRGLLRSYAQTSFVSSLEASLKNLCSVCRAGIEAMDMEERAKVWSKLPSLFGLAIEGWRLNGVVQNEHGMVGWKIAN